MTVNTLYIPIICGIIPFFNALFGAFAQESVSKEELGTATSMLASFHNQVSLD